MLQSVVSTDRKRAVISFLEKNGQAKVSDFINVIGLSDGHMRALLREMVGDGTIEKIGDNRYTHYIIKRV
jgi:DNA-binding Lrp family transcriptional regulator